MLDMAIWNHLKRLFIIWNKAISSKGHNLIVVGHTTGRCRTAMTTDQIWEYIWRWIATLVMSSKLVIKSLSGEH